MDREGGAGSGGRCLQDADSGDRGDEARLSELPSSSRELSRLVGAGLRLTPCSRCLVVGAPRSHLARRVGSCATSLGLDAPGSRSEPSSSSSTRSSSSSDPSSITAVTTGFPPRSRARSLSSAVVGRGGSLAATGRRRSRCAREVSTASSGAVAPHGREPPVWTRSPPGPLGRAFGAALGTLASRFGLALEGRRTADFCGRRSLAVEGRATREGGESSAQLTVRPGKVSRPSMRAFAVEGRAGPGRERPPRRLWPPETTRRLGLMPVASTRQWPSRSRY